MSVSQQALPIGEVTAPRPTRHAWFGGLHGADYVWAISFAIPYVALFLAFVLYPICYGLWLGSDPALYSQLFADPRYFTAVLNTVIYVGVGVNLKMFLAFMLSGYFMRKGWWVKTLLVIFILPWATPALPAYMSIPQELYEAAAVDGATGIRKFAHVTYPLMANLYLVCILLDTVFALCDFNSTYFVSGGGPAMSTEVLATLGFRYAFTVALPRLGVAEVMTALPVLIPLVYILMRKLRVSEGQL